MQNYTDEIFQWGWCRCVGNNCRRKDNTRNIKILNIFKNLIWFTYHAEKNAVSFVNNIIVAEIVLHQTVVSPIDDVHCDH